MKAWKQFEADAAALFNGKRFWANSGERLDFEGSVPRLSLCDPDGGTTAVRGQCKLVKSLSLEALTKLAEEPGVDVACTALSSGSGVGRKKAERLVLELQDKFGEMPIQVPAARAPGADEAVQALTGLGYGPGAADEAVRAVLADGAPSDTSQLIRRALQRLAAARGGR